MKFISLQFGTKAINVNDAVPSSLLKLIHMRFCVLCVIFSVLLLNGSSKSRS